MEQRTVVSTSRQSATTDDIVLRQTQTTRLVFRPLLVTNPRNEEASVKGTFMYQRRGLSERSWEDLDATPLSSIKAGDQYRLELKSEELAKLYREVGDLYQIYRMEGIPPGETRYVRATRAVQEIAGMTDPELRTIVEGSQTLGAAALTRLVRWAAQSEQLSLMLRNLEPLDPQLLSNLRSAIGIANLKQALKTWLVNRENSDEGFWQSLIERQAFILEQVFAVPIVIIRGRAYVGGKMVTNQGGQVVDFLTKNRVTKAVGLVEIKTPMSQLVGPVYREGIRNISTELTGAVMQVLSYRESLVQHSSVLGLDSVGAEVFNPRCLVLIGDAGRELRDTHRRRSFELYRNQLHDVDIVTYDEMFDRTRQLVRAFEGDLDS